MESKEKNKLYDNEKKLNIKLKIQIGQKQWEPQTFNIISNKNYLQILQWDNSTTP